MHKLLILLFLLFSFMKSQVAFAQQIITDRPDQTESSSTIPKASFQIETGLLFQHFKTNEPSVLNYALPGTLLRYGLTDVVELRLANQIAYFTNELTSKNRFGISDVELGAKIQILRREDVKTEISFITHVVIPIGSKDLTINSFATINKLSIAHYLSSYMSIGYNLGYNYFGEDFGNLTYSVALGFALTKKLGFYIEPYGDYINFETILSSFDGGFTYLVQDNIQVDISYGFGTNYTMNYTAVGLSWNFAKSTP